MATCGLVEKSVRSSKATTEHSSRTTQSGFRDAFASSSSRDTNTLRGGTDIASPPHRARCPNFGHQVICTAIVATTVAVTNVLRDTIDFFVDDLTKSRLRDQPARVKAALRLLDKHSLWKPRSADDKKASNALVQVVIQRIFFMFGDSSEAAFFRKWDRACGKDCARLVVAFGLQKHRFVKEFWTYSKHGLAQPIRA